MKLGGRGNGIPVYTPAQIKGIRQACKVLVEFVSYPYWRRFAHLTYT